MREAGRATASPPRRRRKANAQGKAWSECVGAWVCEEKRAAPFSFSAFSISAFQLFSSVLFSFQHFSISAFLFSFSPPIT
jgi:hypothetical protein